MEREPSYAKVKENFYMIESPQIRENPWYLTRKPGKGTYAEIAEDSETGVFIAPWPFNKHVVVEEFTDPELRRTWDEATISEAVLLSYGEISRQLADPFISETSS